MPSRPHPAARIPGWRSRYQRDDRHLRFPELERIISGCPDRYFITLTSKRDMDSISMSAEVGRMMQKVNTKVFGMAFKRRDLRLVTLAVQEETYAEALHTHMLVGVPEDALAAKVNRCPTPVPDLIIKTWITGDPQTRRADAQDARDIDDFAGVRRYIYKGIRFFEDLDNVDLNNTRF